MYPDAEKRILDINKMAKLFEEKGYLRTSQEILSFAEILKHREVPPDFLKKFDSLFDLFHDEFVKSVPVGRAYRKQCFREVREIIFGAVNRTYPNFGQIMLALYPLIVRLNKGRHMVGSIAEWLAPGKTQSKELRVHLSCYGYLITVEGLFDELCRILYFFAKVSKSNIPSIQELEKITVWSILDEIKPTPVFLDNWDEKKHIRNAIGHARAFYDLAKDEIQFIDIDEQNAKVTYDRTVSFAEFAEMMLELDDTIESFYYITIMLRIFDLILSKSVYS